MLEISLVGFTFETIERLFQDLNAFRQLAVLGKEFPLKSPQSIFYHQGPLENYLKKFQASFEN